MIHYKEFETKTGGRLDALDVTPEIDEVLAASGVKNGSVLVFSPHTTCCVTVANGDGKMIGALGDAMKILQPTDGYYEHDDFDIRTENLTEDGEEPENAPAHMVHIFAGRTSEVIPVSGGNIGLGDHQRVYFVELCSSRLRRYCIQVIGE
ncbi:MAG: secondary thiamine-phosphate synthase enzyme YjbQ [Actinomycetota bacterium]